MIKFQNSMQMPVGMHSLLSAYNLSIEKKIQSGFVAVLILAMALPGFAQEDALRSAMLDTMKRHIRTGGWTLPSESRVLTLEDCLRLAGERNGRLVIAKEEYRLSLLKHKQARRDLFPNFDVKYEEIDGTTTGEDFRGEGTRLEMQYPIYTSGRIKNQYKQARVNLEVARLKHDQVFLDVFTEIEKAFYIWMESKIQKGGLEKLLLIESEARDVVKKRFDQGHAREIDWQECQILSREVDAKAKEFANDDLLAEMSLRQLIDDYAADALSIEKFEGYAPLTWEADELVRLAMDARPDILLNRMLEKVKAYNKAIARAEGRLQVSLDGYMGERAENFASEDLVFDDEYYIGFKASVPLGTSTVEGEVIDQDTVPSAGQTTSTQFQSYSVKLNLMDNQVPANRLESLIAFYQSVEDTEKIKKAVVFECGKQIIEMLKAYDKLELEKAKADLAAKKLEFMKLRLSENEAEVNDYLREAIEAFDATSRYTKALSGYYLAVAELNKALGRPGYFNPQEGSSGHSYFKTYFESQIPEPAPWYTFGRKQGNDPYFPDQRYEQLRFSEVREHRFWFIGEPEYEDLESRHLDVGQDRPWWQFWGRNS